MFSRLLSLWVLLTLFVARSHSAQDQESWMGLFLNGRKVGYAQSVVVEDRFQGAKAQRTDARTWLDVALLGTPLRMDLRSSTWSRDGRPIRMTFRVESSGRVQTLDARFLGSKIDLIVENGGQTARKTLEVPKDGPVVDDPIDALLRSPDKSRPRVVYVLDPLTASLVRNEVKPVGPASVTVLGRTVQARRVDLVDPRAGTKVFLDERDRIVKAEGPMGIEMVPMGREEALAPGVPAAGEGIDLASASRIVPEQPIRAPWDVRRLKVLLSGAEFARLPSDAHQTVTRTDDGWVLEIHPVPFDPSRSQTIAQARAGQPAWVKPTLYVPAEAQEIVSLAKRIVGPETNAARAAAKIHDWVYAQMRPNAGIGVLRDAREVLKSKEGVCRDYAVLTAALLRAAGIPARLASGLVYQDGAFYYHAWAEAWTGRDWLGVDSTRPRHGLSALHIKISEGNVEEAYNFPFLDKARLKVLETAQ
ncbi:MAG: transglutaminase-like domain-containing protein [Fimbriimonadales bacterium]|nr:transglutaminase-like domain-containing protein [Fimbriimonadales bacterium]